MKKWFEYQIKNQRTRDYKLGSASQSVANIALEMATVFEHVLTIYPTPQVTRRTEKVFSKECAYTNSLAANVSEIDHTTLDQWIYDPDFKELLDRQSHEVVYFHESHDREQIVRTFCEAMRITYADLKDGLGSVKLHVQHPGQMFALHFDRPQHKEFEHRQADLNHRPAHTRFLLFMQDQVPGQVFQMDHDFISWQKGDVFSWDARNTMHGSCNFGFWPRFMMMFTLKNIT